MAVLVLDATHQLALRRRVDIDAVLAQQTDQRVRDVASAVVHHLHGVGDGESIKHGHGVHLAFPHVHYQA